MAALPTTEERREPIEIDGEQHVFSVTFSTNSKYLVSGHEDRVVVWRTEDGTKMATMETGSLMVWSLAVSNDGRWIAAGTTGQVFVWDANTYEQVFKHQQDHDDTYGVDFSPDGTRLVSASNDRKASVWDVSTGERVLTLDHDGWVIAARYSPRGDRIATAISHQESVRVYDSDDGRLLVDIPVIVTARFNTGLLWSNDHLFVVSANKIKQIEASTGVVVSELQIRNTIIPQCIALPKRWEFIAYSAERTVTFWDSSTHDELGVIEHPRNIRSIAISPDDRFLAIGEANNKIVIESISHVHTSAREKGQQDDHPSTSRRHDNNHNPPDSARTPSKSTAASSEPHNLDDGNDLDVELPSSQPAAQFNYEEPPSPIRSIPAAGDERPPRVPHVVLQSSEVGPADFTPKPPPENRIDADNSSRRFSMFRKWIATKKNTKGQDLDDPYRLSRNAHHSSSADLRSRSWPLRVNRPPMSTYAEGRRQPRTVSKYAAKPKRKTPRKSARPPDKDASKDTSRGNQGAVNAKEAGPVHLFNDGGLDHDNSSPKPERGKSPSIGSVRVRRLGSKVTIVLTLPERLLCKCCRSGIGDGWH